MSDNVTLDVEFELATVNEGLEVIVQDAEAVPTEIESDEVDVTIRAAVEVMQHEEYEYQEPEILDPAGVESYDLPPESERQDLIEDEE